MKEDLQVASIELPYLVRNSKRMILVTTALHGCQHDICVSEMEGLTRTLRQT
jgi:hypothetical protein